MPLSGLRLALLGAGNMGEALVRGLLHAHAVEPAQLVATDPRADRLEFFRKEYGVEAILSNVDAVRAADIVVLAVKPQILDQVATDIAKDLRPEALVISIAAGVPIAAIAATLPKGTRIVRVMPNICVVVKEGATGMSAGADVSAQDLERARAIFEAVGNVVQVEESLLDAVTALSGSGPAYLMLIIEALSDAGVRVGLPRYQAQALAAQTVLGSAKLLIETGAHPGVLKDQVTSPGGTAIAGLHTLEEGGLRTTLINAVVAATERSKELGKSFSKGR
ncbi:MAG: pyrroline-5-carboxylate reductase [Deltaproteobacteria bacterium]|nr:pyrroline-5-carboxylate reductase [Deltaproteobacteria bacterium]